MLCHLDDVPNYIKFCHNMSSGKDCGNTLGFISDDKQAQTSKYLPNCFVVVFNDGFNTVFWR